MRLTARAARPASRAAAALCAAAVSIAAACSAAGGPDPVDPGAGVPAVIVRQAGDGQEATVASALPVQPTVVVRDASGRPVPNTNVVFTVTGDGWVTRETVSTDHTGSAATTWYLGASAGAAQRLRATTGGGLQTEFTATATPLVPGTTYGGAHGYVELMAGDLPVIISAPHGGALEPATMPTRTGDVTTVRDAHTEELAREIAASFHTATGGHPHVIIMRLHRRKVDANREIGEGAQGNAAAERAWREFHGYIEAARAAVVAAQRPGLHIDLHGHGHDIQRLELGYMLSAHDLAQDDATLNTAALVQKSSMRAYVHATGETHSEVIRGAGSLGTLFDLNGYPAVPSQQQPHPGGAPYFSGGYSTGRHASADGNLIAGVQIEANMTGVRDTAENRRRFAEALVAVLGAWQPALLPQPAAAH